MTDAFEEILTFFANSFYGSLVIGAVCPLLGVYFIVKRMAFLGVAVPQFSAAGLAFGFLVLEPWNDLFAHDQEAPEATGHFSFFLSFALLFTFLALLVLVWLNRRQQEAAEGRIAVGYALAAAATILCLARTSLGQSHLDVLLRGEILTIRFPELLAILAIYGAVTLFLYLFRRELLLSAYDSEAAISLGMRPALWDATLYLLAGTAISVGVLTVGPLVIFGLMIIPAMAARPIAFNMTSYCVFSSSIGLVSAFCGFLGSYLLDLPLGPTLVVTAFLVLALVRVVQALVKIPQRFLEADRAARTSASS